MSKKSLTVNFAQSNHQVSKRKQLFQEEQKKVEETRPISRKPKKTKQRNDSKNDKYKAGTNKSYDVFDINIKPF